MIPGWGLSASRLVRNMEGNPGPDFLVFSMSLHRTHWQTAVSRYRVLLPTGTGPEKYSPTRIVGCTNSSTAIHLMKSSTYSRKVEELIGCHAFNPLNLVDVGWF